MKITKRSSFKCDGKSRIATRIFQEDKSWQEYVSDHQSFTARIENSGYNKTYWATTWNIMNRISARQIEDGKDTIDFSDRDHDIDRYKVILEKLDSGTFPSGIYFFQEVPYGFVKLLKENSKYQEEHFHFVEDYFNSNRGGLLIFTNLWFRAEIKSISPIIVSWIKDSQKRTSIRGLIVNMVINFKEIKLINVHIQKYEYSDLDTILDKIDDKDEEVILGGDLNMNKYDLLSIIHFHKVNKTHDFIVFSFDDKSIDHIVRFQKKTF
jgi:hypothetical protein